MNTLALNALRYYNSLYASLLPHNTVGHALRKTAPQFMLIPYDVDQNHSRTHTNVRLVWVFYQFRSHKLANVSHQRPIDLFLPINLCTLLELLPSVNDYTLSPNKILRSVEYIIWTLIIVIFISDSDIMSIIVSCARVHNYNSFHK